MDDDMHVDAEELDLVSTLPPEILLKITEYISVRDGLRCTRVCRNWNEIFSLGEMWPFWRRTCLFSGLPDYYVRRTISQNPRKLFNDVRKHRESIAKLDPAIEGALGEFPLESTTKCEYAGQGYFIKTIDYSSIDKKETIIGQLCPEKKSMIRRDSLTGDFGQASWGTIIADNVVWQTQDNHWYRYDIYKRSFHKLFTLALHRSMGDTIGYCRHCFFFVQAGTENTMHGYSWQFKFIKVVDPDGDKRPLQQQAKTPIPPGITQFIPRPVKAHLLPEDDNCSSHRLVIQGGTGGCVYRVTHNEGEPIKLSPKPIGTLNPFYDAEAAVMVVNTTSEMTLSHDEQVVGMVTSVVYPYASGLCLHIFDVNTYHRITSVQVNWKESFNDAEVLSLSRLYTVLGVGHSKGILKVVDSHNGKVLMTQSGLSRGLPPVIPMARLLFIHYQGVYNEESLVDVQSPCSLVVLFRKGVGNMEALYFHPFPEKPYAGSGIYVEEESEDDREE